MLEAGMAIGGVVNGPILGMFLAGTFWYTGIQACSLHLLALYILAYYTLA